MAATRLTSIDRSSEKAHIWVNELSTELGTHDDRYAYSVLRAVLHTLRDRTTVNEAAQFAAQLPDLVRGIYYEEWKPNQTPEKYHNASEFLNRIVDLADLHGRTEANFVASAVMRVIRQHVSEGELEDLLATYPEGIRELLAEE